MGKLNKERMQRLTDIVQSLERSGKKVNRRGLEAQLVVNYGLETKAASKEVAALIDSGKLKSSIEEGVEVVWYEQG